MSLTMMSWLAADSAHRGHTPTPKSNYRSLQPGIPAPRLPFLANFPSVPQVLSNTRSCCNFFPGCPSASGKNSTLTLCWSEALEELALHVPNHP